MEREPPKSIIFAQNRAETERLPSDKFPWLLDGARSVAVTVYDGSISMNGFDKNWTPITSESPAPTTGTTVTGHVNGQPVPGTMQEGTFTPNT